MKKLSTWLLVAFMVMFWAFRVVIAVGYELKMDIAGIVPFNQTAEIALLFIALIAMILIVKRKVLGAVIYLASYIMYFGATAFQGITGTMATDMAITGSTSVTSGISVMIAVIGIVLPIAVTLDIILDKGRQVNPTDKKTDWFYKEEKFDRELDERADKNNYRTM